MQRFFLHGRHTDERPKCGEEGLSRFLPTLVCRPMQPTSFDCVDSRGETSDFRVGDSLGPHTSCLRCVIYVSSTDCMQDAEFRCQQIRFCTFQHSQRDVGLDQVDYFGRGSETVCIR